MRRVTWFVVPLMGVLAAGCDQGDPAEAEPGTTTEELLGAPKDLGHEFSVGVCTGPLQADGACPPRGTPNTSRCTGTLVAPNLVLTARHCTERVGPPTTAEFCSAAFNGTQINAVMQITTNPSVFDVGATWHAVESIQKPPGKNNCTDDVVLLTLASNVPNIEPAAIDLSSSIDDFVNLQLAIVGRGATVDHYDPVTLEPAPDNDNGGLQRRRAEHIPFVCAPLAAGDCSIVDYWSDPPVFEPPPGLFAYGPSSGPGDSGAAVFPQMFFDNEWYLAIGVNTLGTMAADGSSSGAQGVLVAPHATFIRAAARAAAARGDYPVPYWAL